jgi:hypothetical protein
MVEGDPWITLEPLNFWSRKFQKNYVVPKDFVTDLASVPRLPLVYLLTAGTAHAPAIVHDFQYRSPRLRRVTSKAEADSVFYEGMLDTGVPSWRAWLMWRAVKNWGGKDYVE